MVAPRRSAPAVIFMARDSDPPELERALAELEQLVETLERGDLPLEEALRRFERGVELTRHCQSALKSAQQRVEMLLRRDGEAEPVPFEAALESGDESEDRSPSTGERPPSAGEQLPPVRERLPPVGEQPPLTGLASPIATVDRAKR